MLGIVGALTLGLAGLAVRLGIDAPSADFTLLADVARAATGGGAVFAVVQAASALLLLAAAASSYLVGSGLLEVLAAHGDDREGLLPRGYRRIKRSYVPPWGVATLAAVSAALGVAAGGHEQSLVQYYAAVVFASFLGALVASTVLSWRDRCPVATMVGASGALAVAGVLLLNLRRLDPVLSLGAAAVISVYLWRTWVARGRPGGIARIAT